MIKIIGFHVRIIYNIIKTDIFINGVKMSDHTLELADDWDLHVGDDGNLPRNFNAQGIAQNVANAFRLFTNDAYFFTDQGIPHFIIELNAHPKINILRSRLKKVALQVEGVKDCEINLMANDENRALNGYAELTLINGEKTTVAISGL
jgi:hypothetical protein